MGRKRSGVSEEYIAFIFKDEMRERKESSKKLASIFGLLLGLLFDHEDGSDIFLRNVGLFPKYTALQRRKLYSS
jgi:hypothetical protein